MVAGSHAVTMAALMEHGDEGTPDQRSRSPREALRRQLRAVAERFSTPVGRHVTAMPAASDQESELAKAFRNHFVLARRAEGRELLRQAIVAGELRRDVDLDVALDLLYGAMFFRLLLGHAPLDARFADQALEQTFRGDLVADPRLDPLARVTSSRRTSTITACSGRQEEAALTRRP